MMFFTGTGMSDQPLTIRVRGRRDSKSQEEGFKAVVGWIRRGRRMDRKQREEGFKDAGVGTEDARGCEDGEDAFQEAREYIPRGGRMIRSSERQEMRGRTSDMRRQQGICKGADVIVFFCYENTLWT